MSAPQIGWVNAHTHLYSGLAPFGIPPIEPPPRNLLDILQTRWWRMDRALDASSLRAAARWYVADALSRGTTALIDHHESPNFVEGSLDVLADACQELGMRALLCYGATERNGGREEARRGLAECRRLLGENERELVRGLVGLHASFTVSDETLREAGELAREFDTVVHVHLAEDSCDVEDARRRGYASPLQRMLALRALPPGSILAHGVHLTLEDTALCGEHELWLVQNPRSNHSNRVGYPKRFEHMKRVALGTDGWASDMIDETEMLILEAASHGDDPRKATTRLGAGQELFARCFGSGLPEVIVAPGLLLVGQRLVVDEGVLRTANLGSLRLEAQREAKQLWKRMNGKA